MQELFSDANQSLIFDDIMSRGRNISTEFYSIPGSFKAFEPQTPCYLPRT